MDIELFDKRYVYLEWSDELEGKDCVLAKSYKDLKDFVNSDDEGKICKVKKGKPFINDWGGECDFCYYDPNLKVKKAWIEGKTIQKRDLLNEWEDYIDTSRTSSFFYNIKWDAHEWKVKPNCYSNKSRYYSSEPRYYLSINENDCLKFTISQNKVDDVIYEGTRKECERMLEIIGYEFHDYGKGHPYRVKFIRIANKYSHEKYKRRMTNRELSEYLAKGNGEMKTVCLSSNVSTIKTSYDYIEVLENKEVDPSTRIRDFGSDEWREPLKEI